MDVIDLLNFFGGYILLLIIILFVVSFECKEESPQDKDLAEMFEARVDVRKFLTFINSPQVSPDRVICSKFL